LTNSIGMKLALIPAGEFWMGSPETDKEARQDEKPQHHVRITKLFYMGVYTVTQEEYQRVTGINPSFFAVTGPGKDKVIGLNTARFPVEQIRWPDAIEFCRRLSELPEEKQAGRVYRLPTEAEWEYACRAGTTTAFHFGDSLSSQQANFNGNHPYGGASKGPFLVRTTEVGSYAPNAFGLYDMHGNVWQWTNDWYGLNYYRESPVDDPPGPSQGSMKVIRGGEWYAEGRDCRSAFRYADLPTGIFYVMGFRVVMTTGGIMAPVEPTVEVRKPPPPTGTLPERNPSVAAGEDWPQWRGPRSNGTWRGPKLVERWPAAGLRCLWRQPIGGGYSGVAVRDGRVYTLDYAKEPDEIERLLCFEGTTGKLLWSHAYPVTYGKLPYGSGPRTTPTIHEGRVYALGTLGHLHCLDATTGKPLWSKHLVTDLKATMPGWGFAASPLLFEEQVIIHAGGEPDACLIALDRQTGDVVWRNLPDPAGYATPILIRSHDQWQLVAWTEQNIRGLDPRTGKLLWTIPFAVTYGTAIASPIFQDGLVLVSGYYEGSKAIQLGPEGTSAAIAWEDRRNLRGVMSTPLYRSGHGYLLDKRDGLVCFEWKTGKKLWDDGNRMTPKGRNSHATLVWLGEDEGDRALVLNSEGDLILTRLNTTGYQELARTNIIGPTWAHPAYAGDRVYARNDSELVCVSLLDFAGK
jgi:formylglycine-generating enzyme required for sulfatase activity/outer membrane protein assembly factor BamB